MNTEDAEPRGKIEDGDNVVIEVLEKGRVGS